MGGSNSVRRFSIYNTQTRRNSIEESSLCALTCFTKFLENTDLGATFTPSTSTSYSSTISDSRGDLECESNNTTECDAEVAASSRFIFSIYTL